MKENNDNITPVKPANNWWHVFIITLASIPVYTVAFFYTDEMMSGDDVQAAFLITVYFMACVLTGRYLAFLLVNKDGKVSRLTLIINAVITAISITLMFILLQASSRSQEVFLRILVVGLPLTVFGLSLGIMIKLIRTSVKNQLAHANATAAQSQDELRFLQNQLSPHFLFNTLNNIYGISLTQHEKVSNLLLKLSDLLRYSVYDAKELFVPLKNEIAYIKDYIDFEKIRIGDKLELEVAFDDVDASLEIAPLLLIVFIENAFKHSKNTTDQNIYIKIIIKTWANSVFFAVKNSCSRNKNENSIVNKDSGFGLENVIKRLDLLYGNKYDLQTEEKDGFYNVMLQLKTK